MTATASTPNLHPMSLGELLDRAFRLYRQNFLTYVGVVAVMQVPVVVLQMAAQIFNLSQTLGSFNNGQFGNPAYIFSAGYWLSQLLLYLLIVVSYFLTSIAQAAVARSTADTYLTGSPTGIVEAYRKIIPALGRLLLALLLAGLILLALGIWFVIPCIGWLTGGGALLYFSWVVVPLLISVCALERQGVSASLRRAWDLARPRFWWMLGFMGVLSILGLALSAGPTLVVVWLMNTIFGNPLVADDPQTLLTIQAVIQSVATLAVGVIYSPVAMISQTLAYLDLRTRSEGLDLAISSAPADGPAGALDLVAQPPRSPPGPLITGREVGYFALLSVGAFALFITLYAALVGVFVALFMASGLPPN